jgi:predicted nucleic acid-binding protein
VKVLILDSGPMIAWFCPRDEHHAWARQTLAQLPSGIIVCEAVLAEVCHVAARDGVARGKVVEFAVRGRLALASLAGELPRVGELLNQYAERPMDFTDACVVRLAEIHVGAVVCTTDRDFLFYRKNRREEIPLLAPFSTCTRD